MKKLLLLIAFSALSLTLTACNPISYDVRYNNVKSFDKVNKRTIVSAIDFSDRGKIERLTYDLMGLGKNIDIEEARYVAREAVLFPQYLANQYRLVGPPNKHNVLVNEGKRKRGLCYEWAQDMSAHIGKRHYNTLSMHRVVANQGTFVEHNVLSVSAKGKGIKDAFILDGWRNSGKLLWMKTGEDQDYDWVKYTPQYPNKAVSNPALKTNSIN